MKSYELYPVEILAIERGMLDIAPKQGKMEAHQQNLLLVGAANDFCALFAEHNHTAESATKIREDIIVQIATTPSVAKFSEAIAAVVSWRTPIPAPRYAIDTPLCMAIGVASADAAIRLYPGETQRQRFCRLITYVALIAWGPVGAPLPWEDKDLPIRRRLTHVPDLSDDRRAH